MSKPEVPSALPEILSTTVALTEDLSVGRVWDVGVQGLGFMISTLDQESPFEFRSYEVQSIPKAKPRIDDQNEPGEQTLFPWWTRAQHSWHEGAGQDVFDSAFSSRYKFKTSKGINIWEEGQATLLKDTDELRNDSVDDHHLLSASNALFYTFDGNVQRDPDPDASGETDESTLSTHSGTAINSITSDGESLYAAFSGAILGIKKTPLTGALGWTDVNAQIAVELIAFVKGRLIGAKGPDLYEYDLSTTTEPESFHKDLASTWKWTGITESGPAVYFSGFASNRSEIFAARLTAQDIPFASISTLGAMRSVWQAPEGETIHTIKGYLGKQLLIGTSRGVRVGAISTGEGDIEVSGLIAETPDPVLCFEPQLEFAWFGWSRFDSTDSGLGRVHLGDLVYASDLMYPGLGDVKEVVQYNDRMYFTLDEGATSRIIKEHADNLVPTSLVQSCEVRFNTTEIKAMRYFDILTKGDGKWSLQMATDAESGFSPYESDNPTGGYEENVLSLEATRFCVRIILERDPADATRGPILLEWRLRAEPRATGRFRYLVPLMVYDSVQTKTGREVSSTGLALSLLSFLEGLYRNDADVAFQPLHTGVPGDPGTISCVLEDVRFKSYASPNGGKGFGGIALIILREVR